MSNIKQALESAIEWIERYADRHGYHTDGLLLINKLKISLDELEKCEPVAYLKFISRQWLVSPEIGMDGFEGFEVCDKYGKGDDGADAFAVYTSPQPCDCEPVAEAIRERDRLGFAVVNVIGKLDEIIENTQEVEVDDFLHIAVPIDMWNELEAALEDMPKRADLYTSPQPREWVGLSYQQIREIKNNHPNNLVKATEAKLKQLNTKG